MGTQTNSQFFKETVILFFNHFHMKVFGWVMAGLGCFLLLSFLGFVIGVISLPFHTASNLVQTAHDITDKTINADNAIYNYEWFKQQKEDIEATGNKIVIAQQAVKNFEDSAGARSSWAFEDKTEYSRLNAVEQGLKSSLEDMVATYNARSKMANRAIFQDGLIPDYLEVGKNILTNIHL